MILLIGCAAKHLAAATSAARPRPQARRDSNKNKKATTNNTIEKNSKEKRETQKRRGLNVQQYVSISIHHNRV